MALGAPGRKDGGPPARQRALRHVAALSHGPPLDPGLRVTLNFHPDRRAGGTSVLDALAEQGVYASQFVTDSVLDPADFGTAERMGLIALATADDADALDMRRHPDYRVRAHVGLGARIAREGRLGPRIVGDAARTGRHDPQAAKRV